MSAGGDLVAVSNAANGSTAAVHLLSIFKGRVNHYTSEAKKDNSERRVVLNISSRKTDVETNRYLTSISSNKTTESNR